jgi:hypothetical protein
MGSGGRPDMARRRLLAASKRLMWESPEPSVAATKTAVRWAWFMAM